MLILLNKVFFSSPKVRIRWEPSVCRNSGLASLFGARGVHSIVLRPCVKKSCEHVCTKSVFLYFLQGGDGLQHVATNNPLYITDNPDGGHGLKTDYEKERETIFAGVYVINSSINAFPHFFV